MAQTSAKSLAPSLEKELFKTFYQLLADIEHAKEAEKFSKDFFGKSELSIFAKRLAIAVFLDQGHSYEHIKRNLNVSTATISTVAEDMQKEGFQLALQKIKAEQWADRFSSKIMRMFKTEK